MVINFAANLSMLYTEKDFMKRFKSASEFGFKGVEYLFPYDFKKEDIKKNKETVSKSDLIKKEIKTKKK